MRKLKETSQLNSKLIGQIKYFNLDGWDEYKVPEIDMSMASKVLRFIDEPIQEYMTCLIVSKRNKCSTIATCIIYLLMKYKWNVHRSLEYINARKNDIEITYGILKKLQVLEQTVEQLLRNGNTDAGLRSDWVIRDNLQDMSEDDRLSTVSQSRLGGQQVIRRQTTRQRFKTKEIVTIPQTFMEDVRIQVEDEAALINQYLNSQKVKREKEDSSKKDQQINNFAKTMKQLIEESLLENKLKQQKLEKQLNWEEVDKTIDPKKK